MRVYYPSDGFCGIDPPMHPKDAGYDLHAPASVRIPAKTSALIYTGVQIELPDGSCALVIGRSSLNQHSIFAQVGLIDSGYRGSIGVVLYNASNTSYLVLAGDRIAQIVILPCLTPALLLADSPDELSQSERGSQGFGSTGK